jgi:TonB-linked SusC/RagA family outer membrane protein
MNTNFTGKGFCRDALARTKPLFYLLLSFFTVIFSYNNSFAQTGKIQGTVYNEKGTPLPDVTVKISGTTTGTVSDQNGRFAISAKKGAVLTFSFVGYEDQQVTIGDSSIINAHMAVGSSNLSDVVVVGYGTQKKATLTGAVSSVTAKEIVTTKNENLENSLTGKIPGLRVVQNSSEPGSFNNSIDIRNFGNPLVVIDGVPRDNITRLDANDVESISVLKDASAAVYGVRGANGVILITTKKGKKGELELTYNGTYGWQVPYGLPKPVDAVDYMILANEQSLHNVNGGHISFTQDDIDAYRNGTKQSTDWYSPVVRKAAPQTQHNISATGGSDNTTYYVSLGYTEQQGIFKSNDLNYKRYNLRSNLSTKISKNLTFDINLSGILDEKDQPYQDAWWIIRSFWRQLPTQTIYANNNPKYLQNGQVDGSNPVALSNAAIDGYKVFGNKWFQSSAAITYNIPFVQGLSLKGLYSYDYENSSNKIYQKQYNQYNYDAASDSYNPIAQQSPSSVQREFYEYPNNLQQLSLNYLHTFSGVHNVSALVLYEQSYRSADNFYAYRQLSIPVDQLLAGSSTNQVGNMRNDQNSNFFRRSNKALVGRVNYNFQSK